MIRVAIQGIKGSFHDIAAHRYFEGEDVELICCDTFEEVFAAVEADDTVVAMVAIIRTFPSPGSIQAGFMAGSTLITGMENSLRIWFMQVAVAVLQASTMAFTPISTKRWALRKVSEVISSSLRSPYGALALSP